VRDGEIQRGGVRAASANRSQPTKNGVRRNRASSAQAGGRRETAIWSRECVCFGSIDESSNRRYGLMACCLRGPIGSPDTHLIDGSSDLIDDFFLIDDLFFF
jgi:hypothetical protein